MKVNIFKEWNEGEKMTIDIEYDEELDVLMILTNNGEFVLFRTQDPSKSICLTSYKLHCLLHSLTKKHKGKEMINIQAEYFFTTKPVSLLSLNLIRFSPEL